MKQQLRHALVVLGSALLAFACGRAAQEESKTGKTAAPEANVVTFSAEQVQHGGVHWTAATASQMVPTIEVPGQLVPDEDHTARIGAPAQARIMTVHVRIGDRVASGQPLVTLQSQQASAARADVQKAEAEAASRRTALTYARMARERAERLLAAKAAARAEVERAQADEQAAQATLAQAEAELSRARASVRQLGAVDQAGDAIARAPISGVVFTRNATPGAVVEAGAPLVSITDDSTLWLEASVADRAASALRNGAEVHFTVPAFSGETFTAAIQSVGSALDPQTRTVPVRALVQNRGRKLRASMFATVLLGTGTATKAVAVPESAVVLVDEKPAVFVATPNAGGGASFERRSVVIGAKRDGQVLIAEGVRPGDVVVTEGAFAVKSQIERSKMPAE